MLLEEEEEEEEGEEEGHGQGYDLMPPDQCTVMNCSSCHTEKHDGERRRREK